VSAALFARSVVGALGSRSAGSTAWLRVDGGFDALQAAIEPKRIVQTRAWVRFIDADHSQAVFHLGRGA
jgi:hypothetical protein